MKKYYKILMILLVLSSLEACTKSTSSKSTTTTTGTSSNSATTATTTTTGTSTTVGGISCDGVNNNTGATKCYYKNIPTIQVMGIVKGSTTPLWSSRTNIGTSISQGQFSTDEIFNVRIVPRMAIKTNPAVNPSVAGKSCDHLMTKIATKLFVQIKLQTKEEDLAGSTEGEVATLSAAIDTPSNVWHFSKRVTASNLVMKVVTVLTDSRCQQGGTGYCPYADLPLSTPTSTLPTECVAFDIQYSTDETYDLPGSSAN